MKSRYLLFLIFLTFSCKSPDNGLYKIDPRTFVENKITLADIADDIKYIPLDDSIPIGLTYKLLLTDNNIYLSIKDVGILKYDRFGKLICKVGNRGRGPAEYHYFMDYTVDELTGNVFVLDRSVIKVYSQTGLFVRDINYNQYLSNMGGDVEIFNSLLFIPDYIQYGNSKFNWVFLDTLGNLVSEKENSVPTFSINMVLPGKVYKFGSNLFYFNALNDTIFSISPDLKHKGAYLFSQGDFRWPIENFEFSSIMQTYNIFKPLRMFETKHLIFLQYSYLDRSAISLIDKKTKKIFLAYKNDKIAGMVKTRALIVNNLDGGLPLSASPIINYYVENDSEYLCTLINPFDLKVYLSTDEFKNSVPKNAGKKNELEKLANNLKETDNPVLMLVRLKR
jgi:hypothetical protein